MIERYQFLLREFHKETSKELQIFSIIAQSFFQPFSLVDNLLVILTALTAGPGVGFNRAMLFLASGDRLKGEFWLGPGSAEEAASIWRVLSTPGIGYLEIIAHNKSFLTSAADNLTKRIKGISYPLSEANPQIPALAAASREIILVRDSWHEPLVDPRFQETIGADEFLCIPLLAEQEVLGAIILDNAITRLPIKDRDIELASICGLIAGNYIYTSNLQRRLVDMKRAAAMGEMAMFVTHQLRNPIVTVGGFADQLLDPKIPESKKKRNIQIIRNEIREMERILLRLGQFLRVQVKEQVPVDVRALLRLVTEAVSSKVAENRVSIRIEVEDGLSTISCDPLHVGEALRNLVDNAIDAMGPKGEIRLSARRDTEDWAVISVQDEGPGIPNAVKGKIFDAFVSTKQQGMGLGLPYVKRVVDACGGRIEVESEEGKGTTFRLYLKAKPRERETPK